MQNNSGSAAEAGTISDVKLDRRKLFGFRNLVRVTHPGDDLRQPADLAFNKRGDGEDGPIFRQS